MAVFVKSCYTMACRSPEPSLYPSQGYLYWTDWGDKAHIGKVGLDGSQPRVIVNTSLGKIFCRGLFTADSLQLTTYNLQLTTYSCIEWLTRCWFFVRSRLAKRFSDFLRNQ